MHFPNCATLANQPQPEVGMGATLILYSDRHPYTIIQVSASGKTLWMQADQAIRLDKNGQSEVQKYRYEPDPEGKKLKVLKTKTGWKVAGDQKKVWVGIREMHYDYNF